MEKNHAYFLMQAQKQAQKAYDAGEVPIGAVLVKNNTIVSRGHNKREQTQNAIHHAEVLAISKACKKEYSWRLDDYTLYVTLEPCLMCAGAIMNARIKQVYFAVFDNNASLRQVALQSKEIEDNYEFSSLNHTTRFTKLEQNECKELLQQFFLEKRKKNRDKD